MASSSHRPCLRKDFEYVASHEEVESEGGVPRSSNLGRTMDSPLLEDFVPLHNFLEDHGEDFANTCFIAVVANLRNVLPPVMKFLVEHRHSWSSFVTYTRTLRDDKHALKFGSKDGNGQHDATELLGAILPDPSVSGYGVQIIKVRSIFCCDRLTEKKEDQAMLPLQFPEERREYRLNELLNYYQQKDDRPDLECVHCRTKSAGTFTRFIHTGLKGKMVFRVNRYAIDGKRSDRLILDSLIATRDAGQYKLEAILEHSGSTGLGGHYIIYLLLHGRWEKRNDAQQTFCDERGGPLRYNAANVHSLKNNIYRDI